MCDASWNMCSASAMQKKLKNIVWTFGNLYAASRHMWSQVPTQVSQSSSIGKHYLKDGCILGKPPRDVFGFCARHIVENVSPIWMIQLHDEIFNICQLVGESLRFKKKPVMFHYQGNKLVDGSLHTLGHEKDLLVRKTNTNQACHKRETKVTWELLTKHMMGTRVKNVNVIEAHGTKSFDKDDTHAIFHEEWWVLTCGTKVQPNAVGVMGINVGWMVVLEIKNCENFNDKVQTGAPMLIVEENEIVFLKELLKKKSVVDVIMVEVSQHCSEIMERMFTPSHVDQVPVGIIFGV
ncbi:hypothetical protein H5410_045784 [Solanum commersonii]|uniref:Uncharacterized protein n=1 Tax=Solanum commersonii TaxID=4109 RepID=A0A9J5XDR4_SOLCO|nr:hypothetical protein H5410_045784 [Solanum commersonii]